jgi:hypothetical protein
MNQAVLSRKENVTAGKEYKTFLFDYLDPFIIRGEDKKWIVDPHFVKDFEVLPEHVEVIERRANENFIIHVGEKYYHETGVYDGFYDFKIPMDLREVINKYDMWPEQD